MFCLLRQYGSAVDKSLFKREGSLLVVNIGTVKVAGFDHADTLYNEVIVDSTPENLAVRLSVTASTISGSIR